MSTRGWATMSSRSRVAFAVATVMSVVAALVITWDTAYLPMRVALVCMAGGLSAVPFVLRASGRLPALADGRAPAITRGVGWLLVGSMTTAVIVSFRDSDTTERVTTGIPVVTVLLAAHLIGIQAVTARPTSTGGRGLGAGAAFGLGAAGVWLLVVAVRPPVPGNAGLATLLVFAAVVGAGYWSRRAGRVGAALTAGTIGSLSIVVSVGSLMSLVPDRWVPQIVTVAMTPAANVSESRIETADPYVALLLLGAVCGAVLVITFVPGLARRLERLFEVPASQAPASALEVHTSARP
ncbi:hypothetical protein [Pedococcus bigeumensis]|nr:hypothetical protein [Pedococcus bigeumensis]